MNLSLNDRKDQQESRSRSGLSRISPRWAAAALAVTAVLAGPVPAYAEGSWTSSLGNVRSGFISREWSDRNSDGVVTKTSLSGCSRDDGATFALSVDLRRKRSLQPDVSYGRKNVAACKGGTGTGTWGDQTSGTYFLQFWHHDFGTVSASRVATSY